MRPTRVIGMHSHAHVRTFVDMGSGPLCLTLHGELAIFLVFNPFILIVVVNGAPELLNHVATHARHLLCTS